MRLAVGLVLTMAALGCQAGEIFKCRSADGKTSFSDRPCAADATTMEVPKAAQKDAPVNWLCDVEDVKKDPIPDLATLPERQRSAYTAVLEHSPGIPKKFAERSSLHVCAKAAGAGDKGPTATESVITSEGQVWIRAGGKVQLQGGGTDEGAGSGCVSRIKACMRPGDPAMQACVESIPSCGIGVTGGCCPADCLGSVSTSIDKGMPVADAVERLLNLPACAGAR